MPRVYKSLLEEEHIDALKKKVVFLRECEESFDLNAHDFEKLCEMVADGMNKLDEQGMVKVDTSLLIRAAALVTQAAGKQYTTADSMAMLAVCVGVSAQDVSTGRRLIGLVRLPVAYKPPSP